MNKFIGSGRLAKEPECRYTQSGKCVCSFSLAMDDGWGENKKTTFLPIIVWDKQAEACGNNLIKGQQVVVEGRMQVRSYTAQDGSKRWVTECVAQHVEFGAKPKGASGGYSGQSDPGGFGGQTIPDEDIPF